jgi:hypothetical protein
MVDQLGISPQADPGSLDRERAAADHEHWMQQAILQARTAAEHGEVPVGAVLV